MKDIFFTSDHHFGHANIIKYSNRPFAHVDEMNEQLIANWNSTVPKGARVYHCGDIALCDVRDWENIRRRLNGQIYLLNGNHEYTANETPELFVWIKDYFKLKVDDPEANVGERNQGRQEVVLFHYPIASWDKHHHGAWHLHGHCHSNHNGWKAEHMPNARSLDIGIDSVALYLGRGKAIPENYRPLSYFEVREFMRAKRGENVDHHVGSRP